MEEENSADSGPHFVKDNIGLNYKDIKLAK